MLELEKTAEVYSPIWGAHLGDCVVSLNYCVHESHRLNQCVRVSDHYFKINKRNELVKRIYCCNYYQIEKVILEANRFTIVKDDPICCFDRGVLLDKYRNKKFATNKYQFSKKNIGSNLIAYQFDSKGMPNDLRKFPSEEVEKSVIRAIENMGFKMIKVGWPLNLEESSETLSKVELLVCVMSGMAWVAATARTPTFFVGNGRPLDVCTSQVKGFQTYLWSQDEHEIIENIGKYKEDRDFYNENCIKIEWSDYGV